MIQAVNAKFKALWGVWFLALQVAFVTKFNKHNPIFFCCGASTTDINGWFHTYYLPGSLIITGDFSRYDSTQVHWYVERETDMYYQLGLWRYVVKTFGKRYSTKDLLRSKMDCWTYCKGCRFRANGGRKTGDVDTCVGNTILSIRFYVSYLQSIHVTPHFVLLGDDNLCIIHPEDVRRAGGPQKIVDGLVIHAKRMGLILKVTASLDPFDVEFLSCKLYPCLPDENGYRFHIGKKIIRALIRFPLITSKQGMTVDDYRDLLVSNLKSQLPLIAHVPIISEISEFIMMNTTVRDVKPEPAWFRPTGALHSVSNESKLAVCHFYHINLNEYQRLISEFCRAYLLDPFTLLHDDLVARMSAYEDVQFRAGSVF